MNSTTETLKKIDKKYELEDHLFREDDHYALAKYNLTIQWIKEHGELKEQTLLNVGCGGGFFNLMAAQLGMTVTAVEPELESFRLAHAKAQGRDIQVYHGDIHKIPDSQTFDFIVMHDVLEHIDDDAEALKDLKKHLKPDGTLILSVPALQSLYGLHDELLGHFRRYNKSGLRKVVAKEFQISRIRYYGFAFIPLVLVLSKWLRKPYPQGGNKKNSWVTKVFRFICQIEIYLNPPIGTSIILQAQKRPTDAVLN